MKLPSFISPKAQGQRFIDRSVNKTKKYVERKLEKDDISDPAIIEKHSISLIEMSKKYSEREIWQVRANLLKDRAFPADIRELRKITEWSDDKIVNHYWTVPKFVELWSDVLGMDRDNLVFCVRVMSRDKDWEHKDYLNKPSLI